MRTPIVLAFVLAACASTETPPPNAGDAAKTTEALTQLDRSMSQLSARSGIGVAFAAMFDADAVSLHSGEPPVRGRDSIVAATVRCGSACSLTWEPVAAEADGNLGYTWGTYVWTRSNGSEPAQRATGNYVTIWKRNDKGEWKAIVDTGTTDD